MLEFGVADEFLRLFNGGGLAFNVSEDVGDLRDLVAHVGFEFRDLIMGFFERHALIEFDVLLDMELPGRDPAR